MTDLKINAKELGEFLLEAKRNTWASGEKAEEMPDHGKKYSFYKGQYAYTDTYYGSGNDFIGHKLVFMREKPYISSIALPPDLAIWGMNYRGVLTEEGKKYHNQEGLWNFLREALRANDDIKMPFRGPNQYPKFKDIITDKDKEILIYQNLVNVNKKDILDFDGKECIVLGMSDLEVGAKGIEEYAIGDVLYELNYNGGKL